MFDKLRFTGICLASALLVGTAWSEVAFTVSETTPSPGSGTRTLTTTLGSVSAPAVLPTMTYTVTGVDLTSVGGTASETIVFDVNYTQAAGIATQTVGFNTTGNVAVTTNDANQIDTNETLVVGVLLNTATTFTGPLTLAFNQVKFGDFDQITDTVDFTTTNGTVTYTGTTDPATQNISNPSPLMRLKATGGALNLEGFTVNITARPGLRVSERIVDPLGTGSVAEPNTLTSTKGAISLTTGTLPTMTYQITGVDLTSVGGTASETIVFDVAYTQTGGSEVQFSPFGNVAVTGNGSNVQIDPPEALTATLTLNTTLTTYTGPLTLAFSYVHFGGFVGTGDVVDLVTDSGTTRYNAAVVGLNNVAIHTIKDTSFVKLDTFNGNLNLQSFDVNIIAADPSETLKVTSITRSGSTVTVAFEGVDGKTYRLNKSTDLSFAPLNITDTITLSGSSTGVLEDTTATEPKAFYRVERP